MPKSIQCKKCANLKNDWCKLKADSPDPELVRDCQTYKAATYADRIRAMSDEELAVMFAKLRTKTYLLSLPVQSYRGNDVNDWLDWLRQEAEDGLGIR